MPKTFEINKYTGFSSFQISTSGHTLTRRAVARLTKRDHDSCQPVTVGRRGTAKQTKTRGSPSLRGVVLLLQQFQNVNNSDNDEVYKTQHRYLSTRMRLYALENKVEKSLQCREALHRPVVYIYQILLSINNGFKFARKF